jgi:hypothetical protein
VICPKCGENNADNFRFCGMCGALLEARQAPGTAVPNLTKIVHAPEPLHSLVVENAANPANKPVPPISGPSMLGLNQTGTNQPNSNLSNPSLPSMDTLRESAFSGLDSFREPEQAPAGARRIFLLVALLAALGGAGWWTYTNYVGAAEGRKPGGSTSSASETPAEKPRTPPTIKDAAPALDAGSAPAVVPSRGVQEGPAEIAKAAPDLHREAVDTVAKPVDAAKPVTPATIVHAEKRVAKRESRVASARTANPPAPAASDTGDAAFRKGEAYLYGRGVPENCDEAVKNLKAASAKSNAKARSAFGTMYATGHCVPRDLPTSYLWFALALRVDPNNQILEKDLSAVWNQMTPPERQMATRMKQ